MDIRQELLKIASDLESEKYIKEFILVYESFFKSLDFNVKTKLDIASNSYSKEPNYFNVTMIASKEDVELTFKAIIGYDVSEKSNAILILSGHVNGKAIRNKRDSFSIKDALIPTKFINKKNLEKAMNTALNKKFSRADAMILLDKNFIINSRFGEPKSQNPEMFIQITDEAFVKISRSTFRTEAYWYVEGVYLTNGKYKLTIDKAFNVRKSFQETEEGMKDLITHIKSTQVEVRKELAKRNDNIIISKNEDSSIKQFVKYKMLDDLSRKLNAKNKIFQNSYSKNNTYEYELIFVVDNKKSYVTEIKFVEKNNDVAVTIKFNNEFVFDQNTKTFSMNTDFNKIQEWIYKSITNMANL